VNWHVYIQTSLEVGYLLLWSSWFIGGSFVKDLFENERRKGKLSSMDKLGQ